MARSFAIHEAEWIDEGSVYARGQMIRYRVGGMRDGKT